MGKSIIIGIVAVIVLGGGGYLIFHKSPAKTTTSTPSTSTTSSASASNGAVIQTKTASGVGQYLADSSGSALYTYDGDNPNVSNCTGSCLQTWPAYTATSSSASLPTGVATIKRSDDDTTQYTYKSKPLYRFTSDSSGKVTGDGVNGFHIAKP